MKLRNALLFATISLITISCSKEKMTDKAMDKLEGTWRFEKVKFINDSKLLADDKTDEYKGIRIVFKNGGEAMKIDHYNSDTAFGTYEVKNTGFDTYSIKMSLIKENADPYVIEHSKWTEACIHKKSFNALEVISNSTRLSYDMKKE